MAQLKFLGKGKKNIQDLFYKKYLLKNRGKTMEVGTKIHIVKMAGEPHYSGREGVIKNIDSYGQLHGTWGGLAVRPDEDEFYEIKK